MMDFPKSPSLKRPPKALLNNPKAYSQPGNETVRLFLDRGYSLAVLCRDCDRLAEITPPDLARIFSGKLETRIADLQGRLKCSGESGCGSTNVLLWPHLYEHAWTRLND